MIRSLVLSVALGLGILPASAAETYVIGERASDFIPGDLAEITALTSKYGSLWLVDVRETYFLEPPNLQGSAYLAPEMTSATLRRGRFVGISQEESSAPSGYDWRVDGRPANWAQVAAPGQEFGRKLTRPRTLDRPFRVEGDLLDDDLLSLVTLIRGSPSMPGRSTEGPDGSWSLEIGAGVDGRNPIITIEMKADREAAGAWCRSVHAPRVGSRRCCSAR